MSVARRRRRLLAVWLVFGALLAVIGVLEYADHRRTASAGARDPRWLLPARIDELGAVEIADAGRLHRFERDAKGAWFYHGVHTGGEGAHTHAADPALSERIERALAAFGRTRVERQFRLDGDGAAYGVAGPEVVVLVYRGGETRPAAQYAIGHVAPDTASRYVLPVGAPTVVTIPGYQVDNLLALVRAAGKPSAAGAGVRR